VNNWNIGETGDKVITTEWCHWSIEWHHQHQQ